MVYNTNLMVLVGGGESPKWPTNKCMLWDDAVQKIIGELSFNAQIKSIRVNKQVLLVSLFLKTYIFNFRDLTLIDCLQTYDNPSGLCDPAYLDEYAYSIMASLTEKKGCVRLRQLKNETNEYVVSCHQEAISALRLSRCGSYPATACLNGTFVRVFKWGGYTNTKTSSPEPISWYMIDVSSKPGQISNIHLHPNMEHIAVSFATT